jgi:hypothetical protein
LAVSRLNIFIDTEFWKYFSIKIRALKDGHVRYVIVGTSRRKCLKAPS